MSVATIAIQTDPGADLKPAFFGTRKRRERVADPALNPGAAPD
jgi:hypothetical protein